VSSVLFAATVASGLFTLGLGLVHLRIPAIFRYQLAIGRDTDRGGLGDIAAGPLHYDLRRHDLVGVAWIMSNAASYALVTIGLADLAWAAGVDVLPIRPAVVWIAGWWLIRAGGQLAIGRRTIDSLLIVWFGVLAATHLALAVAA
jgi:hypothetical protein